MKEELNSIVGQRLKQVRQEKGWSLDTTANNTGVSKAMLGQIERGESSPTIATLWKIVSGFNVSFSSFIAEATTAGHIESIKPSNLSGANQVQLETIFPYDDQVAMETYQLTIAPQYEYESSAHSEGVIEHIIVLQGCISIWFAGNCHHVKQGQALKFFADQPHVYANQTDHPVVVHDVICYTKAGKETHE